MADYVLEIVEGPEAGRMIPLAGPVELGRDAGAGVALQQDELLSRRHVRITPEADGVRVEDLGSRNGTFVDGDEISARRTSPSTASCSSGSRCSSCGPPRRRSGATALRPIPADFTVAAPAAGGRSPTRRRSARSRLRWPFPRPSRTTSRRRRSARARLRALPAAGRAHEGEGEGRADRDLRARRLRRDHLLRLALNCWRKIRICRSRFRSREDP